MAGNPLIAGEELPEPLVEHNEVRALDLSMEHICFPPFAVALLLKVGAFGAQGQERRHRCDVKEK